MKTYTSIGKLVLLGIFSLCVTSIYAQEASKKWGKVTCRYADGDKSSRGHVDKMGRTGTWKFWGEDGHLHHTASFFHDTLNGRYVEYNEKKKVITVGQFEKGCKDGVWRFYADDGTLMSENTFVNGKLDGRQVTWYANGDVREILLCENDVVMSRKAWYPGGRLRTVETYKNGMNEGKWFTYPEPLAAEDTFPIAMDEYVDGKLHGWHYAFLNGKKMEEVHYVAGQQEGTCSRWDLHGHLCAEENYKAGQLDGTCNYYDCSRIIRSVTYSNGQLEGPQTDYGRSGEKLSTSWYHAGYRDSLKTYHPNGVVATRRIYAIGSEGTESSEYTEWNDQGVKLLYGRYLGEQKFGEWYTYYPDGKKMSLSTYENGILLGQYTRWYENGKRMVEYVVLDDGSYTPAAAWNENGKPIKPGTPHYDELVESSRPGEMYNSPVVATRSVIDRRVAEVTPSQFQRNSLDMESMSMLKTDELNLVYPASEVNTSYPGGITAMESFIESHLVHPKRLYNVQGTVYVSYIVEKDGSVTNIRPVQEVNGAPEFTDEALRIVKLFPKQIPGTMNGEPVRSRVVVPVPFDLR
jgi:TonB family protein